MRLILIPLFCCLASFLHAQKFEKYYSRLDKAFTQGDIKTAKEEYYSLAEKFSGRTVSFQDSSKLQYYESRLYRLKGDYTHSEDLGARFVARIKGKLGERSP